MLEWLKISNFALVQDAEIEFKKGLNIISGETGAGKTVIINAISLLLGQRADKTIIRKGETRCDLSAGIKITPEINEKIDSFLEKYSIPSSDNLIILRKVITQSSNRNYINDTAVTLAILNELRELIIDFHGPAEHQSLLKHSRQLELLDSFGNLFPLRNKCRETREKVKNTEAEIVELKTRLPDAIEAEHLKRLINEIEKVSPQNDEDRLLSKKYTLVANSKNILELITDSCAQLYDAEESIFNHLTQLNRKFSNTEQIDPENFSRFTENIYSITEQIKELAYDLENYSSKIDLDEQELANLEERLNSISSLKRKYGPTIEDIFKNLEKAKIKLEELENFEYLEEQLKNQLADYTREYSSIAGQLTTQRIETGKAFAEKTVEKLHKLGFLKSDLDVKFEEILPTANGTDKVEILFSANPGEELKPLRNVASSGELSRVMLAIKTVLSNADSIPILIFDEIDANIGGEIANQVGKELRKLGKKHQILCISHLPQVASFADAHYSVSKSIINGRTFSTISTLEENNRVDELARMLGGSSIAKKHAEEMLNDPKKQDQKHQGAETIRD